MQKSRHIVFVLIFLVGLADNLLAQINSGILNYDYRLLSESEMAKLNNDAHSPVKPYRKDFTVLNDSITVNSLVKLNLSNKEGKFLYSISPLLSGAFTSDLAIDSSYFSYGGGLNFEASYNNKWFVDLGYFIEDATTPSYIGNYPKYMRIIPAMGYAQVSENGYYSNFASGTLTYVPNKFFEFKAGVGKNFIGDGYRSLLLSDNAFQYPYLRINTNFWKLQYTNLFCMMDDIRSATGHNKNYTKKFSTIHYLNWNISKRVCVGIFESVIWQAKDTLFNRQFDPNYLNPVIFYRPVEYSLGSSDNVLMGLNAKMKINDHYQIYGQFILDEFLLKEVLDARGWWANKYGFQFGFKAIEPFRIKGFFLQSEFNIVRPFTYSHASILQNYAHYNQPLAHPLGANFWESCNFIRYRKNNLIISNQTNISLYGSDSTVYENLGGNLYLSNRDRYQDYYNRIGQGIANHLFYNRLSVSYLIDPKSNLRMELSHVYRHITTQLGNSTDHFISIGMKTNLWNSYTDY